MLPFGDVHFYFSPHRSIIRLLTLCHRGRGVNTSALLFVSIIATSMHYVMRCGRRIVTSSLIPCIMDRH